MTPAQTRAYERAIDQNVTVQKVSDTEYLASSIFLKPGSFYHVRKDRNGNLHCDCPAGQFNYPCKHAAAVDLAQLPVKRQCNHCGQIGCNVIPQSRYVGGRGYMTFYYCTDQELCWQRWEAKRLWK